MDEKGYAKEIILDLSGCGGLSELHERLRKAFGFPEYYGRNLDALWDMGHDYIGNTEGIPERVIIRGTESLAPELRAYFLERVMRVLQDLAEEKGRLRFDVE